MCWYKLPDKVDLKWDKITLDIIRKDKSLTLSMLAWGYHVQINLTLLHGHQHHNIDYKWQVKGHFIIRMSSYQKSHCGDTTCLMIDPLTFMMGLSMPINDIFIFNYSPGPWFNTKIVSYQYQKFHCGDNMVIRLSYRHNGISYTGKIPSLYQIGP